MANVNRQADFDPARLEYIHAMLAQLHAMASGEQADLIAYLIELAYIETGDVLRGERPARSFPSARSVEQRNSAA